MLWIMGLVSVGALGVSFLLSMVYLCITVYGSAGRHIRIIAIPSACAPGPLLCMHGVGLFLACIMLLAAHRA